MSQSIISCGEFYLAGGIFLQIGVNCCSDNTVISWYVVIKVFNCNTLDVTFAYISQKVINSGFLAVWIIRLFFSRTSKNLFLSLSSLLAGAYIFTRRRTSSLSCNGVMMNRCFFLSMNEGRHWLSYLSRNCYELFRQFFSDKICLFFGEVGLLYKNEIIFIKDCNHTNIHLLQFGLWTNLGR